MDEHPQSGSIRRVIQELERLEEAAINNGERQVAACMKVARTALAAANDDCWTALHAFILEKTKLAEANVEIERLRAEINRQQKLKQPEPGEDENTTRKRVINASR